LSMYVLSGVTQHLTTCLLDDGVNLVKVLDKLVRRIRRGLTQGSPCRGLTRDTADVGFRPTSRLGFYTLLSRTQIRGCGVVGNTAYFQSGKSKVRFHLESDSWARWSHFQPTGWKRQPALGPFGITLQRGNPVFNSLLPLFFFAFFFYVFLGCITDDRVVMDSDVDDSLTWDRIRAPGYRLRPYLWPRRV